MRGQRTGVLVRVGKDWTKWVSGLVYEGLFVIHESLGPARKAEANLTISHVMSGAAVGRVKSLAAGRRVIRGLMLLGVPWEFRDKADASRQIKIWVNEFVKAGWMEWPWGYDYELEKVDK